MKLLSSSFSSSSPSSTASFDVNICASKSATAGCLAGILRRILCSGTLPTHPSDHITEATNSVRSNGQDLLKEQEKIVSFETPPGLVARLMGLESMPDVDFTCIKSRPNSVSRSRSMNSTDRLTGYYDSKQKGQHHRRAKSTTSFREAVEFVELGNEDFFVLSFENVSESREFRPKERKCELGSGELRQRRTGNVRKSAKIAEKAAATRKKKDDQEGKRKVLSKLNGKEIPTRSCSDKRTNNKDGNNVKVKDSKTSLVSTKTCSRKQHFVVSQSVKSRKPENSDKILPSIGVEPNFDRKKKKNSKKKTNSQAVKLVESESISEDSSPVSVLDCAEFLTGPQLPTSEEDSGSTTTSSRRKLSLEIETCERLCLRRDDNLMSEEGETEAKPRKTQTTDDEEKLQILDEICRLSEAELLGSSTWVAQRWSLNHEEFQSIGEELESEIFGRLVEEVVLVEQS